MPGDFAQGHLRSVLETQAPYGSELCCKCGTMYFRKHAFAFVSVTINMHARDSNIVLSVQEAHTTTILF